MALELSLLGTFQAHLGGQEVDNLRTNKVQALLIYLAAERSTHRREHLMTLLWPGMPEKSARHNLRQVLYQMRQVVPEVPALDEKLDEPVPLLLAARGTIQLNSAADLEIDLERFATLTENTETHDHLELLNCPDCQQLLQEAVALYRGDFLADFYLEDSAPYEDWAAAQREHYRRQVLAALDTLTESYLQKREYEQAGVYAERQLAIDNLQEGAHRQLMMALAGLDRRPEALRQYETLKQLLETDLGVGPAEKTEALYEQLLSGDFPTIGIRKEGEAGREARVVGPSPYRGLAAFREEDTKFFFGREAFTEQLLAAVQTQPLVAVIVGPSGAGKSSVLHAGLLPKLRETGAGWLIAEFRPGSQPFRATAAALLPLLEPGLSETDRLVEARKLAEALRVGEISLNDVVARALEKHGGANQLLLLVDQFEELYTLCADENVRQRFQDGLLAAVAASEADRSSRLVLLNTLRADFMGQALGYRPFADALQDGSLLLGPMNREELQAAIEKPADLQGAAFETGLVDRILDDVGKAPGNLPLLEFALTLVWDNLDQGWLTHAAYEEIGRVAGALARYADQVYRDLSPEEQDQVRRAIVQLVQPGQGTEDTRRVANRADLAGVDWDLIQHLADMRLVITDLDEAGTETVEVVHEALIRSWGQLRDWMAADRAFRIWQERLRVALQDWDSSDGDEGALLRGGPLVQAEDWLRARGDEISETEQAYIQASIDLRLQQRSERDRRRRLTVFGLTFGLIVALLLSVFAFNQQGIAEEQARVAFSRELAAAAINNLETDPERSILLAQYALSTAHTREAEEALHWAIQNSPLRGVYSPEVEDSFGLIWLRVHPDGGEAFVSGAGNGLMLDLSTGETIFEWAVPEGDWINHAVFHPDGSLVVLPGESYDSEGNNLPGVVTILNADSGEEILNFEAHDFWVQGVDFSPDGALFATQGGDLKIKIWALEATLAEGVGQIVQTFCCLEEVGISKVLFSPDGARLVTAMGSGFSKVWDIAAGDELFQIGPEAWYVSYSPDGNYLVSESSHLGLVQVWDAETGALLSEAESTDRSITRSISFSPDGSLVASGRLSGRVVLWEFSPPDIQEVRTIAGHTDQVASVAFGPDGRYLYSSSIDGSIRVWDVSPAGNAEIFALPSDAQVSDVGLIQENRWLVTVSQDGGLQVWDTVSWEAVINRQVHDLPVNRLAVSPIGGFVATAGRDGRVKVLETDTWQEVLRLEAHSADAPQNFFDGATGVAFSPDGQRLVTGGVDAQVTIWDVSTGERIQSLTDHQGWPVRVAYSPDGRFVAIASNEPPSGIWDASTGQLLQSFFSDDWLSEENRSFWSVAFSPDSSRMALGRSDGVFEIWELPEGQWNPEEQEAQLLYTMHSEAEFILALRFSPDGEQIIMGGLSDTIEVRDAVSGALRLSLQFPGGTKELETSADGSQLIVVGLDGSLQIYGLKLNELIALAETRVTRALTAEECNIYLHLPDCPPLP